MDQAAAERKVTHQQARDEARKFISDHFSRSGPWTVQISIPRRLDDSDILLMDYIDQQQVLESQLSASEERVRELEKWLTELGYPPLLAHEEQPLPSPPQVIRG